jgi:pre-mRNA-splicing factor ATP-dependent RNA helicase DHX15/PRP43
MAPLKLRPDGVLDPLGRYPNPLNGKPYSELYKKNAYNIVKGVNTGWTKYRTYADRNLIFYKMHNYQIVLLIAPTGVGKTVIVPKLMAHYFQYKTPIIITTPRQKTTLEAAGYSAFLLDVPLDIRVNGVLVNEDSGNRQVGYKFKDSNINGAPSYNDDTKLLYSTDGSIMTMMTKSDPDLLKYGGIIIDEAHERSMNIDILLGLVIQLCKRRPNFKVIIMSATVNSVVFLNYFKTLKMTDRFTVYEPLGVPGNFTTTPYHLSNNVNKTKSVDVLIMELDKLLKDNTIMDKLQGPDNVDIKGNRFFLYGRDIIAFVASSSDSKKVKQFIDDTSKKGGYKYRPYALVFTKDTKGVDAAIATKANGLSLILEDADSYKLKIIIATPVAESSITFEDPLAYVFDTGLAYFNRYDASNFGYKGYKDWVSQANIMQRCGRTGRQNNGICIRLYSKEQWDNTIKQYPDPNIMHEDLSDGLLNLCLLPQIGNVENCLKFLGQMIEPVMNYKYGIKVGLRNILDHDCVNNKGYTTSLGLLCASYGGVYSYHIVRMIAIGYYCGCLAESLFLAGILDNVRSFTDLFKQELINDMKTDKKVENQMNNIMRFFAHPMGDHLSLLNVYNKWLQVPPYQKPYWEENYGIDGNKLSHISIAIKNITETTLSNLGLIRKLNLLKVYQGGRGLESDSLGNYAPDLLEGINTQADFTEYTFKPGCKNTHLDRIKTIQDIHKNRGNSTYAKGFTSLIGGKYKQDNPQNKKNDSNQKKSSNAITQKRELKKLKKLIEKPELLMRGLFTDINDKPVDLGDVQSLQLSEKLMICIYFGYCNQIGVYSNIPNSSKYIIKYSPLYGNIKSSVLHTLFNDKPNFIVYHLFNIDETEKDNKLSIVSRLPMNLITRFMNAKVNTM